MHEHATTHSDRAAQFYDVRSQGRIRIGIGSALVEKYLVRVQGPTNAEDDDLMVEIKEHEVSDRTACVFHPPTGGVLYPAVMQLRLGRIAPDIVAYLPRSAVGMIGTQPAWVNSWEPTYQELDIEDLRNQAELNQTAADAGQQLGRGHCAYVTEPLEAQHRYAQRESIASLRARVMASARELAEVARTAWAQEVKLLTP